MNPLTFRGLSCAKLMRVNLINKGFVSTTGPSNHKDSNALLVYVAPGGAGGGGDDGNGWKRWRDSFGRGRKIFEEYVLAEGHVKFVGLAACYITVNSFYKKNIDARKEEERKDNVQKAIADSRDAFMTSILRATEKIEKSVAKEEERNKAIMELIKTLEHVPVPPTP